MPKPILIGSAARAASLDTYNAAIIVESASATPLKPVSRNILTSSSLAFCFEFYMPR
jgi:hypothetical protein